ncbi:MAG: Na+/H+ antiporter subunit C, partial [Bacteroidetes bacterium]
MDDKIFEIMQFGVYTASILLILIGLYAALTKKSLIKIVIGLSIV